ncbi:MAG: sulfotransferase family protein [Rhizomicrobium sp.]
MFQVKPLRFPDFICIGAQKAGTTWLDRMLRQHPDVWLPPTKEVHYFNRVYEQRANVSSKDARKIDKTRMNSVLNSVRRTLSSRQDPAEQMEMIGCLSLIGAPEPSDETYGRIFQFAPADSVCGEMTPNYARLPGEAIRHMLELQPKVRILFILRDPIERDWSQLRMQDQRNELQHLSYVERLARPALLGYSDYATTIERYRCHVPAENFLILFFDDMADRPNEFLQAACDFLGLDVGRSEFRGRDEAIHTGSPVPMPPDLYQALRQSLAPVYRRLLSLDNPIVQKWYARHYASPNPQLATPRDAVGASV